MTSLPERRGGTWAANRRAGRGRRARPRARREGSGGRRREPCALRPWQPSLSTPCSCCSFVPLKPSLSRRAPAAQRREAALRCGGGGGGAAVCAVVGMTSSGSGSGPAGIARLARMLGRPIGLHWIQSRAFHFQHRSPTPEGSSYGSSYTSP
jgi:hypothetical protein